MKSGFALLMMLVLMVLLNISKNYQKLTNNSNSSLMKDLRELAIQYYTTGSLMNWLRRMWR